MSSLSSTRTGSQAQPHTNGVSSSSSDKHSRHYSPDESPASPAANGNGDEDGDGPEDEEQEALKRYSRELVQYMMVKYLEAKEDERKGKEESRRSADLGTRGSRRAVGGRK